MRQPAAREAVDLLQAMSRVLCAVGFLALVFTTVNVTRFATSRGVPLPIAILLDPMIGTALAGVLYVDARLASWGIRPPAWSTTLRWGAGCTAALMNTWESLWPDRQIGWPHHTDPAAVLLHLTPALLLIALTETIAAYRRTISDLLDNPAPVGGRTATARSVKRTTEPKPADPEPPARSPARKRTDGHVVRNAPIAEVGPGAAHRPPDSPTLTATPHPAATSAADADLWLRAVDLNDSVRAATGKPVSVWRLRTDLRIGPRRARQIHNQLLTDQPDAPHDRPADGQRP